MEPSHPTSPRPFSPASIEPETHGRIPPTMMMMESASLPEEEHIQPQEPDLPDFPASMPPSAGLTHQAALHKRAVRPRRTRTASRKVPSQEAPRKEKIVAEAASVDENGNADSQKPSTQGKEVIQIVCLEKLKPSSDKDGDMPAEPSEIIPEDSSNKQDEVENIEPCIVAVPNDRQSNKEIDIAVEEAKNDEQLVKEFVEQKIAAIPKEANIYVVEPCNIDDLGAESLSFLPEQPRAEEIPKENIVTHTEPRKPEFQVTTISKIADHTAIVVTPNKGVTTSKGKTLVHTSALLFPDDDLAGSFKVEQTENMETLVIKFEDKELEGGSNFRASVVQKPEARPKLVSFSQMSGAKPSRVSPSFADNTREISIVNSKPASAKTIGLKKAPFETVSSKPEEVTKEICKVTAPAFQIDTENKQPRKGSTSEDVFITHSDHEPSIQNSSTEIIAPEELPIQSLNGFNTGTIETELPKQLSSRNLQERVDAEEKCQSLSRDGSPEPNQETPAPKESTTPDLLRELSAQSDVSLEKDKSPSVVVRRPPKSVAVEIIPFSQRIKDPTFIAAPKNWRHSTELSKSSFVEGIVKKIDADAKPERHSMIIERSSESSELFAPQSDVMSKSCDEVLKPAKSPSQWEVKSHQNPERSPRVSRSAEKEAKPKEPVSHKTENDKEPELLRVFARRSIKHKTAEKPEETVQTVNLAEATNGHSKPEQEANKSTESTTTTPEPQKKSSNTPSAQFEHVKKLNESSKKNEKSKKAEANKTNHSTSKRQTERARVKDATKDPSVDKSSKSDGFRRTSKHIPNLNETSLKSLIPTENEMNKNQVKLTKASFESLNNENRKVKSDAIRLKEGASSSPMRPKPAVLSPKPQLASNKSLNQNEKHKWRSQQSSLNAPPAEDKKRCEERVQRTNSFSSTRPEDQHFGEAPSWLQLAHQRRELRVQRERLLLGAASPSFVLESTAAKPSRTSKVWSMVSNIQKLQMT